MENFRTPGKSKAGEKEQWDVQYRRIKFLLAEIEYRHKLGELIPQEEVEVGATRLFTEARIRFQALPQRVAPQLEGMDVHARAALLTDRVNEICDDIRRGPWITDAVIEKFQKLLQEEGQNVETESGTKTEVVGERQARLEANSRGGEGKREKSENSGEDREEAEEK